MTDTVTIMRSRTRRLAKLIRANGQVEDYDQAKTFDLATMAVSDLESMGTILRYLMNRPDLCIVRGAIADQDHSMRVRRLYHADKETGEGPTLRAADHHWIGLDVEGVGRPDDVPATDLMACAQLAIWMLPGEFHRSRCIVQASASHGIKPGCRLRLWYWASRPVSGAELTYWMRRSPVDPCLFRPAQITYTASPLFETGIDHLPTRIADIQGDPYVEVPEPDALRPPAAPERPPAARQRQGDTPAHRIIARALCRLEGATEGERHRRLRAASYTIGGLLVQAGINEAEAARVLLDAVKRAGGARVVDRNAAATIAWGLDRGRQAPLTIGGNHA